MFDVIAFRLAASRTRSSSVAALPHAPTQSPARCRARESRTRTWVAGRLRRTAQRRYRLADRLESGRIPRRAS
jgi:hypothetical protein